MNNWIKDLHYVLRSLVKSWSLTVVVVVTLGLAIGATLTLFAFVDAVLLEPLPFEESERLVALWENNLGKGDDKLRVSGFNFLQWRERATSFDKLALYNPLSLTLRGEGAPIQIAGSFVTEDYFSLLGVEPTLGRGFSAPEYEESGDPVVLLSDTLWRRQFGAEPEVVGRAINLNAQSFTVVGVLPDQVMPLVAQPAGKITFGSSEEHFWLPRPSVPERHSHLFGVLARLRPGVNLEAATAELTSIARGLSEEHPDSHEGFGVRVVPLVEEVFGDVRASLWILFGAVLLMLLIACANVMHLILVRTLGRRQELSIRITLGAERWRLLWLLVTEGAILVFSGAALGVVLTVGWMKVLANLAPAVPRLDEAAFDGRGLVMVFVLCATCLLMISVIPLVMVGWRNPETMLREAGRGMGPGRAGMRFRRGLVIAEVALALILVIGSGLLVRSFQNMRAVDPGFTTREALVFTLRLQRANYPEMHNLTGFYQEFLREVATLPGVLSAAAAYDHPLTANWVQGFQIVGAPPVEDPEEAPEALFRTVTPGYFDTLGMEIVRGRGFREGDDAAAPGVVLINQALARRYFSDRDPLGQRLNIRTLQWHWGDAIPSSFDIVGVLDDVRSTGLVSEAEPAFYIPHAQAPHGRMNVLIRTARDPLALIPGVRQKLAEFDPTLPMSGTAALADLVADESARPRFNALVLGSFAGISLILAIAGIWGVINHGVLQRQHEIGVRMALGAQRGGILGWVLWHGLQPVVFGIVLGLAGALALNHLLQGLLFGISSTDPATYAILPLAFLAIALLACLWPAHKASYTDPIQVLRES